MTLNKITKQIAEAKEKLAALEAEFHGKLLSLPGQVGLNSIEELIEALGQIGSQRKTKSVTPAAKANGTRKPKRKRAIINDQVRQTVKTLVSEGKTANEIASAVGISTASVATIKRDLGLVGKTPGGKRGPKKRKAKPAEKAETPAGK